MRRHPEIPRAAIAIAIWATAVVAWWVFDTPIQRHVERQVGPDVLVHVGLVVTALNFIAQYHVQAAPRPPCADIQFRQRKRANTNGSVN